MQHVGPAPSGAITVEQRLAEAEAALEAAEVAVTGPGGVIDVSDSRLEAAHDAYDEAEAALMDWADGDTSWRVQRDRSYVGAWRDLTRQMRREQHVARRARPRRRGAGRPVGRRRTAASSRTSGADPGDPEPEHRHPRPNIEVAA